MSRASRFAAAYAVLLAAHDVADHIVQTDHQAAGKAVPSNPEVWPHQQRWARPMAGHVGGYTLVQLVALAGLSRGAGVRSSVGRTVAAVALSAVSHAFIDRRWPVTWLLESTYSRRFARGLLDGHAHYVGASGTTTTTLTVPVPLNGPYLADQACHHAVLTVCAAILAGGRGDR